MKQTSLFFAAMIFMLLSSQVINAQPQEGDRICDGGIGNLSYTTNKPDITYNPNYTNYKGYDARAGIYPGIGYFFSDRVASGFVLNATYTNSSNQADWIVSKGHASKDRTIYFSVAITPFFRYYFAGKNSNRFYAELHAGAGGGITDSRSEIMYSPSSSNIADFHSHANYNQWLVGLMIGFNHAVAKNVIFQTAIGPDYTVMHETVNLGYYSFPQQSIQIVNGSMNFSWKFGFSILFPSKQKKDAPAAG